MEHLSNDHEDRPNQHENSQKLCDKAMRAMRVYGTLFITKKVFHSISCFKESPNFTKVNIILPMEKD